MNLFQGANLHKLWQPMIDDYIHYYCVYTAKLTLASQVLLNSCAQIVNIMRPRLSKELFLLESEKLPLWHFVAAPSNTPLDIQDL